MSKLPSLVPNLYKDLSPVVEVDPTETKLKSLRETVMQGAVDSLEGVKVEPELTDQESVLPTQLQAELNSTRFRVYRKMKHLEMLILQSEEMHNEQETIISPETVNSVTSRSFERSNKGTSLSEFDVVSLFERKQALDREMEAILTRMEAEDFYTEQMSALLLRSQEAMLRSRAKTDQLRYLQKRLLKRHEEISTLQTRAANEFIHTTHSVAKTAESFQKENKKKNDKIQEKRSEMDEIRHEVESMSESLARHLLKEQESDLHSKRIKTELARLTKVHSEVRLMENANRDSIARANDAMEKIRGVMKRHFPNEDEDIQWADVLKAYNRMQNQALSLNDHFTMLTSQENALKLMRDSLESQLLMYLSTSEDSKSLKAAVQERMEHLFPDHPTFTQMKLTLNSEEQEKSLEKQVKDSEKFSLSLILNCQEALQRAGSYLTFIGKYVGGLDEKIVKAMNSEKIATFLDSEKHKTTKQKAVRLEETQDSRKSEVSITSPLSALRDSLLDVFSNQSRGVTDIISYGSDILPVRLYASSVGQREIAEHLRKLPAPDPERSAFSAQVLSHLIEGGSSVIRQQAVHVTQCMSQLLTVVSATVVELEDAVATYPLSEDQRREAVRQKEELMRIAAGPPLENLPEKLVEQLSKAMDGKIRGLASQRGLVVSHKHELSGSAYKPLGSYDSQGGDAQDQSKKPISSSKRVTTSEMEAEERVRITQALLKRERQLMKLGVSPRHSNTNADVVVPEKISQLTSIKRAAELEKKLLEQVQGIEVKLKQIKSRGDGYAERKFLTKPASLRLPPLVKSATQSSLDLQSKSTFRTAKGVSTDRV